MSFRTVSSQHLRDVVLEYLVHNAYLETAQALKRECTKTAPKVDDFVRNGHDARGTEGGASNEFNDRPETGLEAGAVSRLSEAILSVARIRRNIKNLILSGRVDEATQLINKYFPNVLQDTEEDMSIPSEATSERSVISGKTPHNKIHYISQVSVNPIHVALNLRILAFIEAARTVPLPYSSSSYDDAPLVPMHSNHAGDEAHQTALLHHAQRLYASVESLADPRDKEVYRKELGGVGGLLAYREPEKSSIAHYMKQERREVVADQVNSAILHRLGQPAISHLELFTRYTSATWSVLHDTGAELPPSSQRPAGVSFPISLVPPSDATEKVGNTPGKAANSKVKEPPEVVPNFDFSAFVNSAL